MQSLMPTKFSLLFFQEEVPARLGGFMMLSRGYLPLQEYVTYYMWSLSAPRIISVYFDCATVVRV